MFYGQKENVVIPLVQPNRSTNSKNQAVEQAGAKVAATETEAVFIQIRLQVGLGQTMIGTQDKRFRIADDNVQPMEQPGVGIVNFMLVDKSFQSRDVAAI